MTTHLQPTQVPTNVQNTETPLVAATTTTTLGNTMGAAATPTPLLSAPTQNPQQVPATTTPAAATTNNSTVTIDAPPLTSAVIPTAGNTATAPTAQPWGSMTPEQITGLMEQVTRQQAQNQQNYVMQNLPGAATTGVQPTATPLTPAAAPPALANPNPLAPANAPATNATTPAFDVSKMTNLSEAEKRVLNEAIQNPAFFNDPIQAHKILEAASAEGNVMRARQGTPTATATQPSEMRAKTQEFAAALFQNAVRTNPNLNGVQTMETCKKIAELVATGNSDVINDMGNAIALWSQASSKDREEIERLQREKKEIEIKLASEQELRKLAEYKSVQQSFINKIFANASSSNLKFPEVSNPATPVLNNLLSLPVSSSAAVPNTSTVSNAMFQNTFQPTTTQQNFQPQAQTFSMAANQQQPMSTNPQTNVFDIANSKLTLAQQQLQLKQQHEAQMLELMQQQQQQQQQQLKPLVQQQQQTFNPETIAQFIAFQQQQQQQQTAAISQAARLPPQIENRPLTNDEVEEQWALNLKRKNAEIVNGVVISLASENGSSVRITPSAFNGERKYNIKPTLYDLNPALEAGAVERLKHHQLIDRADYGRYYGGFNNKK